MGWKRAAFIAALAAAEMGGEIWNPITEVQGLANLGNRKKIDAETISDNDRE
jgi:hypothetical protein